MTTMTNTAPTDAGGSYDTALARSELLRELIDDPTNPERRTLRMLTGDRPTGPLHIGHHLASLQARVELQDKGIETFILIADYQVITDRDSVGLMQEHVMGCVLDYLAAGIDPAQSTIFTHSALPELNQLMLPFLSLVTDGELRRNPTVKDELAATGGRALSGLLLTYPVHQAADILFCHAGVVPVGRDQLPHLEQARVIARRFNRRYAAGQEVFREPEALLSDAPLVLGLDGRKMSKSRGNSVTLGSTADETAALIRKARTDSERRITYDPAGRPEVSSMLMTAALFRGDSPQRLAEEIGDGGSALLKKVVIDAVNDGLAEHRRRRRALAADPGYLRDVLRDGNERARGVARATLATVRQVMRMVY